MKRADGILSKLFGNVYIASLAWSFGTGCVAIVSMFVLSSWMHVYGPIDLVPLLLYWLLGIGFVVDRDRTRLQRLLLPVISYAAFWGGITAVCIAMGVGQTSKLDYALEICGVACGLLPAAGGYPQLNCALMLFAPVMLFGIMLSVRTRQTPTVLGCGQHAAPATAEQTPAISAEPTPATEDGGEVIYVKDAVNEAS